MRQVVGLGAVAGQAKSRQSELLGRNARRVWPSVEWRGGSAGGCWAERLALGGFRRAWGWVGLVGHAEWPTRNRSPDRVGTSSDRPLHAERIRRSWEAGKCMAVGPAVRLVVRPGRVVEPEPHRSEDRPLHGEPDPSAVRVWGRAGSGSCGCR